jgi:hypothetical protein
MPKLLGEPGKLPAKRMTRLSGAGRPDFPPTSHAHNRALANTT